MDAKQFDAVARTWATASRRQVLLRGLGAVAAVATTLVNKTGPFNLPIAEAATSLSCALQTYPMAGTRFTGARIKADVQFFDTLDTINQCAVEADVQVVITSSFRQGPLNFKGSAAKASNHMAGHAIDMNVSPRKAKGGFGPLCNDTCLLSRKRPAAVTTFLRCVQTQGVRWGGADPNFTKAGPDPVHLDDTLNINDFKAWKQRYSAVQTSKPCGSGQTCDATGLCQPKCPPTKQGTRAAGCPVDPCEGITCSAPKECHNGECTCSTPCGQGQTQDPATCACACPQGEVLCGDTCQVAAEGGACPNLEDPCGCHGPNYGPYFGGCTNRLTGCVSCAHCGANAGYTNPGCIDTCVLYDDNGQVVDNLCTFGCTPDVDCCCPRTTALCPAPN